MPSATQTKIAATAKAFRWVKVYDTPGGAMYRRGNKVLIIRYNQLGSVVYAAVDNVAIKGADLNIAVVARMGQP